MTAYDVRHLAFVLDFVRQARWFTAERARAYGAMTALMVLIEALNLAARLIGSAMHDPRWRPEPTDFDAFWSGAHLAIQGHAALAYNTAALRAAEAIGAQPVAGQFLPYLYPPIFLMVCLPLALLPYQVAMPAFMLGGYAAVAAGLNTFLPRGWPWMPVLAFPAAMLNAAMGQSGFLATLCFAGGMRLLDRRPALAGACLGMLAYKPHLALCVPLALTAARRWTALIACGLAAFGLGLLSWAVLGSTAWVSFVDALPLTREVLMAADIWPKLLSTYGAVRVLGGGAPLALATQAVCTLLDLACLARVCFRRPGAGAEMAALATAALLCTPYVLDYDLVCLGVPMVWLARQGHRLGWRAWEKALLCVLYIFPLLARILNMDGVPLTPFMLGATLWVVSARSIKVCAVTRT